MDSASGVAAWEALQRARSLAARASEHERAYIEALTPRYAQNPPADRAHLDSAFAKSMSALVKRYPDDVDAATLLAEAMMDLRPWNYWQPNGDPYPGTQEIVSILERVIARAPDHPGACHYYIHAVEAVAPEKAVACAERLAQLMPGAGHLVHMPAHIYIRVGRYNDAIESNVHAVHADETYIASEGPTGVYPIGYYPHNYHFLAFAQMMAGRSAEAMATAKTLVSKVPLDIARQVPLVADMIAHEHVVLAKFGKWQELLALPVPPADALSPYVLAQFTRGMAFAGTGRFDEADASWHAIMKELALLDLSPEKRAATGEQTITVMSIASQTLLGEISMRRALRVLDQAARETSDAMKVVRTAMAVGHLMSAASNLRSALQLEDAMLYFEPPVWPLPVRPLLGAVLLRAGQAAAGVPELKDRESLFAEAEQVYREDLKRFPENGWSLFGLHAALEAQEKTQEAAQVQQRFRRAWEKADIQLTASAF
jgi:tetratricopeptide (TPR) repeat protein